jgi:hypothetical protein
MADPSVAIEICAHNIGGVDPNTVNSPLRRGHTRDDCSTRGTLADPRRRPLLAVRDEIVMRGTFSGPSVDDLVTTARVRIRNAAAAARLRVA